MIIRKDITTGEEKSYNTKVEAAKELNINESSVRKAIKKGRLVMGKYKFTTDNQQVVTTKPAAKILLFDVETLPNRVYSFGLWKQNIGINQIISNSFITSWAAKWLGEDQIFSMVLSPEEAINEDDKRLMIGIWNLLDEASCVVGHNSNNFDIPKLNTRFVLHGLNPPSPYRQIDTLNIARQQFGFVSNRLDYLDKFFGGEGKISTDFSLWSECMIGNQEALADMELYNRQDVVILENVFLKLRPYAKNLPNLGVYEDSSINRCSCCGSTEIEVMEGKYYYTQTGKYPTYRCKCGAISRGRKTILEKGNLAITSIPGR